MSPRPNPRRLLITGRSGRLGSLGCVAGELDGVPAGDDLATEAKTTAWWRRERAQRQAEIDAYLVADRDNYESFKDAPLGNSGIPMIMFRLLPAGAARFDTTRASLGNGGHDTEEFLGDVDWSAEPGKLADLLEYLKTL